MALRSGIHSILAAAWALTGTAVALQTSENASAWSGLQTSSDRSLLASRKAVTDEASCEAYLATQYTDCGCGCSCWNGCAAPGGSYLRACDVWYNKGQSDVTSCKAAVANSAHVGSDSAGLGWCVSNGQSACQKLHNVGASPPATPTPTASPTTAAPTASPTTAAPTAAPTASPTTAAPTAAPTASPTTAAPTAAPTASPTTAAPTAAPTASPTTAAPTAAPTEKTYSAQANGVEAVGDPHMRNLHGQKFELLAAVPEISLLELPRGAAPNASLLHVLASMKRLGTCGTQYIRRLAITGQWAEAKGKPGQSWAIKAVRAYASPSHPLHKRHMTLGPGVRLTVTHAVTEGGTTYLNFRASGLPKAKVAVGGLLGEDDYAWATEKPPECL